MDIQHFNIVLETPNGAHSLKLGEYYVDTADSILYIGIGDFIEDSVIPIGSLKITENGDYIVKTYETVSVHVNRSSGDTPSGEITISTNGVFDVRRYASAIVNVTSGQTKENKSASLTMDLYPSFDLSFSIAS